MMEFELFIRHVFRKQRRKIRWFYHPGDSGAYMLLGLRFAWQSFGLDRVHGEARIPTRVPISNRDAWLVFRRLLVHFLLHEWNRWNRIFVSRWGLRVCSEYN